MFHLGQEESAATIAASLRCTYSQDGYSGMLAEAGGGITPCAGPVPT